MLFCFQQVINSQNSWSKGELSVGTASTSKEVSGQSMVGWSPGGVSRDPVDLPPGRTASIFQGLKKEDSVPLGLGFWQQFTCPRIALAFLDL